MMAALWCILAFIFIVAFVGSLFAIAVMGLLKAVGIINE